MKTKRETISMRDLTLTKAGFGLAAIAAVTPFVLAQSFIAAAT